MCTETVRTELLQDYDEAFHRFKKDPRVVGVDVARHPRGRDCDELAVRLLVSAPLEPETLLAASGRPLFALEIAHPEIQDRRASFQQRLQRPRAATGEAGRALLADSLQPGIGISRSNGSTGTLGFFAWDKKPEASRPDLPAPRRVLVSCWHVLAFKGARPDQHMQIVHPPYDEAPLDVEFNWIGSVGSLDRWPKPDQDGDAAFAYLEPHALDARKVIAEQRVTGVALETAREIGFTDVVAGTRVVKVGYATDKSVGVVDGVGRYAMRYGLNARTSWIDGFRIGPAEGAFDLSAAGDSGAVWTEEGTTTGLGLHFEGNSGGQEFALACHLPRVLARLELDLLP